jgi:hypothetical protein
MLAGCRCRLPLPKNILTISELKDMVFDSFLVLRPHGSYNA